MTCRTISRRRPAGVAALLALVLLVSSTQSLACSCFSPEQRAKTALDALQGATMAFFGRVQSVDVTGKARVLVVEAYKGPTAGETVEALRDTDQCGGRGFTAGEEGLILPFHGAVTACDKYPRDHYLIPEFRLMFGK